MEVCVTVTSSVITRHGHVRPIFSPGDVHLAISDDSRHR